MRRLSIARSVRTALLGLTIVLTAIAAIGVASLYGARQDYEDTLADATQLQAASGRLLAAGVVEEATLRLTGSRAARRRARGAYERALDAARVLTGSDARSSALLEQSARGQARLRAHPGRRGDVLAPRDALAALSARQDERIAAARDDARTRSRRALLAIVVAGGAALLVALGLVAILLAALRRPLEQLVGASEQLAAGDAGVRVDEDEGPEELRTLARAFNRMATDVASATGRVEAERRRLETTVRSLGDALVIVGADGVVAAANPRAAELVPELKVGTLLGDGGVPEPAPRAHALAGETTVERDGRTLAVTASPLEAGAGTVWTVRDVSERARLERLKTEFVATASHELRSPLTSIKGFVELLASSPDLDSRQREFVEIVLASTNRLVDLVNDLLDVARVEAGGIEIHRRPTDLADVVHEVVALMRPRVEEKEQRLEVDVPPDLPRALADPARIRQILTNLLTNAHLYTPARGKLRVAARAAGHTVTLAVADTGRGMTPDEVEHAFDRFYRAGESRGAEQPGGTGLGLAIVKSLVDLHGGRIDVASRPGEGSTFTVRLPRAAERPRPGGATQRALTGKRVLVVDDEREVAELIVETLTPFGVDAVPVGGGEEALARLREEHFDAITLDILMPGMSGFAVLRALREDPELAGIPVVIVSVFSGREALSGERVVAKPIDPDELADALGAAVLAGRVRVLAVGGAAVRPRLDRTLADLGIEHDWAADADEVALRCQARHYEVAVVHAALDDVEDALAALRLRGRRLRRSVVLFADSDEPGAFARLDAEPVALEEAGALVLGLLDGAAG